jgi:lipopolysaccharide/colanic/teichoic acid biosynthesis glycosyltransferase
MLKRILDFVGAGVGLICFAPFLVIIAVAIRLTSPGPALFRQERVGQHGLTFRIFKFRSMRTDFPAKGASVTAGDDARITPLGAFLRRHKLDELPQLINVILGDMSLVGPRPEVKEFVDLFPREYENLLTVLPGITHQGTLMFRNEEEILSGAKDPRARYLHFVMPLKLKIYQDHLVQPYTEDVKIILATLFPTLWPKSYPAIDLDEAGVASMTDFSPTTRPVQAGPEKAMEEMA